MSYPVEHLQDAMKLTADAEVHLYTMTLVTSPVIFRFKNNDTVTWQGDVYEGMAISMPGDKRSSDEEESRPTLRVINPDGIFNKPAMDGDLDRAIITRKTVLREHIEQDINIYTQRMWYVDHVKELISGQTIGLELRVMTDLPNVQLPYRQYIPPEFPTVSL